MRYLVEIYKKSYTMGEIIDQITIRITPNTISEIYNKSSIPI